MAIHKFVLEFSDEQLDEVVKALKEYEPEFKVLDKVKLMDLILKITWQSPANEVVSNFIFDGGNALIGDCLTDEQAVGVVERVDN